MSKSDFHIRRRYKMPLPKKIRQYSYTKVRAMVCADLFLLSKLKEWSKDYFRNHRKNRNLKINNQ